MNNRITELEINNFKSIKHLKMDCKRINVLIGKPNVGKSNILEALALFVAPYCNPNDSFMQEYIRYEKLSNLFYDQDRKNHIDVITNLGFATLWHKNNLYKIAICPNNKMLVDLKKNGDFNIENDPSSFFKLYLNKHNPLDDEISSWYGFFDDSKQYDGRFYDSSIAATPFKKYHFKALKEHKNNFSYFLNPPHGENLYAVLEGHPKLWDECAGIFNQYGLDLLLDTEYEKIDVQKKVERRVTKIPYALAADTLQRYIFHLAAIETNNDSILLFEEPESHSFPPYIAKLAERIIESNSNQFFIATHSPYLLTPFIERSSLKSEDVAIFVATYENYETKVKALSDDEINNILETGIDLFFNIRAFQE